MKLQSDLVIELTRRCNMNCAHCLRGCSENLNISKKIIRKALSTYTNIPSLTLTGGEPSLVPDLIKYVVDYIIEHHIDLGGLYIVTNGKVYSQKMVNAMRKAYAYAYEPDMCGLCVSVDPYHDGSHYSNYFRYCDEPFFRKDKEQPNLDRYLINEGNAMYNGLGRRNLIVKTSLDAEYVSIDDDVICVEDTLVYVNANGDILLDCDVSYENQELYAIGNLTDSELCDIILANTK